ncbi:MAG: YqaA family protein [Polyangiales bacterium]
MERSPAQSSSISRREVRGLAVRALLAVAAFFGALLVVARVWHQELVAVSRWFVTTLGGPGLAVGFFIPDALTIPLPQDAFTAFAYVGGMGFWGVVAWASAGSLAGGSTGWLLGRRIGRTGWWRRLHRRYRIDPEALAKRYGAGALAIGALTPLPYSIMCWTCGALGMGYGRFIAVSLLRIVRVAVYLWLIALGVGGFDRT